jgi:hypothetical protein
MFQFRSHPFTKPAPLHSRKFASKILAFRQERTDFGFRLASQGVTRSYGLTLTLKDTDSYDCYVPLRAAEIMKIIKISVEKKARVSGLAFKVSGWNGCWLLASSCAENRPPRATARLPGSLAFAEIRALR